MELTTSSAIDCPFALPEADKDKNTHILPVLSQALYAWHTLGLEIGEAAIVTGDHEACRIFAQAALWRAARPVIHIGSKALGVSGVCFVPFLQEDPGVTAQTLSRSLEKIPGVAVVELSGDANIVDIVLETMPVWGRILFGAPQTRNLTLDYYSNLHRKGISVYSDVVDLDNQARKFSCPDFHPFIENACRILSNPAMMQKLDPSGPKNLHN